MKTVQWTIDHSDGSIFNVRFLGEVVGKLNTIDGTAVIVSSVRLSDTTKRRLLRQARMELRK